MCRARAKAPQAPFPVGFLHNTMHLPSPSSSSSPPLFASEVVPYRQRFDHLWLLASRSAHCCRTAPSVRVGLMKRRVRAKGSTRPNDEPKVTRSHQKSRDSTPIAIAIYRFRSLGAGHKVCSKPKGSSQIDRPPQRGHTFKEEREEEKTLHGTDGKSGGRGGPPKKGRSPASQRTDCICFHLSRVLHSVSRVCMCVLQWGGWHERRRQKRRQQDDTRLIHDTKRGKSSSRSYS